MYNNVEYVDEIKDNLAMIAGKNILSSDNKQIANLVKCINYLITQVVIIDESDRKEKSSSILENVIGFL